MNPENSPLVKQFTLLVLKTIYLGNIKIPLFEKQRQVINSDLIPTVSEKIIKPKLIVERETKPIEKKQEETRSEKFIESIAANMPAPNPALIKPRLEFPKKIIHRRPVQIKPRLVQIKPRKFKENVGDYVLPAPRGYSPPEGPLGKIEPLLKDPAVTVIECPGPGRNISIIRTGEKEFTRLVLKPDEINAILENIAMEARVPLIEGVFRAAVENFVISAVVSDVIGSRFMIKKQTPYSLIDPTQQNMSEFGY